jgi:hypothetical protein
MLRILRLPWAAKTFQKRFKSVHRLCRPQGRRFSTAQFLGRQVFGTKIGEWSTHLRKTAEFGLFAISDRSGTDIPRFMKAGQVRSRVSAVLSFGVIGQRTPPAAGSKKRSPRSSGRRPRRFRIGGQAQSNLAVTLSRLGPKNALALFADWTDRIAACELPFAKPQRPEGVERNVVISMWEWSTPKAYLHDAISTDKRNPRVNANGLI